MNPIERAVKDATDAYRAGMGLPPLRTRYFRARCESLIRDTGCDDLAVHEAECEACQGGWSVWERPEAEERRTDDPRRGQAAAINKERS